MSRAPRVPRVLAAPRVLAVLALVLLLAACGAATPSPTATPSPSEPPTPVPSGSVIALPSFTSGAAPELEALIPDQVGDATIQKVSMLGGDFLAAGGSDPAAEQFLTDLGVAPDQVSLAFGFGTGADLQSGIAIFIFRAEGAGADRLLSVYQASLDRSGDTTLSWMAATVGGKTVQRATEVAQGRDILLYASGDTLFVVSTTDPADAETILAGLP